MKYRSAATRMGLITAALVFLFTLTAIVPVEAKQFNLRSQLRKSGVSMKIVKLDRTDGFVYGISFTGPENTLVIAPRLNGMWLLQAGDNEVILQRNTTTDTIEIIQANSDINYILCILKSVFTLLSDWNTCDGDMSCEFNAIMALVDNYLACNSAATTSSTTTISTTTTTIL